MEYFRRLLGALQETLDYVSSFTTYLLGDETHPGAEQSGHTREMVHRSSLHDSERETATHSGVDSLQGQPDTFERPFPAEVSSFNQEIHDSPETIVIGARDIEAILESSESSCKCEGQDVAGQMFSESPQFLTDSPKLSATSTVIGNDCQRDLEMLAQTQELHQQEPECTDLMEGIQQEGLEEVGLNRGCSPDLELKRTLAGKNKVGEHRWRGGTDGVLQPQLERTQKTEQETDWPLSVVEQPIGLEWTGEIEHEGLKELTTIAENKHLGEAEESVSEKKWGTNEGVQQTVLDREETEGNQDEVLKEVDRIHQWEPRSIMIAFKEQELKPKRVAEEGNSHQSGLEEEKDLEDHQQEMPEVSFRNKGQVEDKQEEQMHGIWEDTLEEHLKEVVLEKTETRVVQPCQPEGTERNLQEEFSGSRTSFDIYLFSGEKMIEEAEKRTEEREEEQQEVIILEDENQPWVIEGIERRLYKESMGSRNSLDICSLDIPFGGEQIVGESEKLNKEQEASAAVMLEEAETGELHSQELERTERSLLLEPTKNWDPHNAGISGGEQVEREPEKMVKEQVTGGALEEAETGGHQQRESEVPKRRQDEEPMGSIAPLDTCFFGKEQMLGEPEDLTEEQEIVERVVLEETETGEQQPRESEVSKRRRDEEPMGSRAPFNTCLFGGEQKVGGPEDLTEEPEVERIMLEEAETAEHQSQEPGRTERSLELEPTRNRAHLNACISGEEKVEEPEMMIEEQEEVTVVVLEEAGNEGHRSWESGVPKRRLDEEPMGSGAPLDTCFFGEEQMLGEPEDLTEEHEIVVERVVLEEAETGGGQPLEPEGPERSLHDEPTGSKASPDACRFAGLSTFPDQVLSLDTSAQKERVILRRKSSIRRAPSLKKPRLPTETQPQPAVITEVVSSPSQAPRLPNPRRTGFGPMHPNMMAELQLRMRRPQ